MNRRKRFESFLVYVTLISIMFIFLLPIINMVFTSLKPSEDIYTSTGLLPKRISFENYYNVLSRTDFGRNMLNSLAYSIIVSALTITISSFAGYAFSRYSGVIFNICSMVLLMVLMFPMILILIPMFMIFNAVNLVNTPTSIIISYLAFQLPFSIWMLRGFFESIPKDLEEAALIDGCSRLKSLFKIILPLSLPGLATVAIFCFIRTWNEYMMASVLIPKENITTISVGLRKFMLEMDVLWGRLLAGASIATVPTIIFLLFTQKYLVQGLTSGAVKG